MDYEYMKKCSICLVIQERHFKSIMRNHLILIMMGTIKIYVYIPSVDKDLGQLEPCTLLV